MTDTSASQLVALLGRSLSDPSLTAALEGFQAARPPRRAAYVDLPKFGLYFAFRDDVLSSVTFNSSAMAPYETYAATLPFGLTFSQGREAIRLQLGLPELTVERRRLDRWRLDQRAPALQEIATLGLAAPALWVAAFYGAEEVGLVRVVVQVPDA